MIRTGDFDGLRGSESKCVRLPPDDIDLWMSLQQVLRELEALILMPLLAPELTDDLDVGEVLERLCTSFGAVHLWGRALLTVDYKHLALPAGLLGDPGAHLLRRRHAVGRNEGVARRSVCIAIDIDDGHPSGPRGLDRNGGRGRARWDID